LLLGATGLHDLVMLKSPPKTGKRAGLKDPFSGMGPRAIATTSAVEMGALKEFVRRGFDKTTAEHIAAASGASVRTFFRYFPRGKQDVMVLQFRRWVYHLSRAMNDRPDTEPAWVAMREAVRMTPLLEASGGLSADALVMHRKLAQRQPDLYEMMTVDHHAVAEPIVQLVAARMMLDARSDLRPRLMVHSMLTAATVTWLAWLADDDLDAFAAFEGTLDVLERGLGSTGT
jgi:AcrR family transcriptional regulator